MYYPKNFKHFSTFIKMLNMSVVHSTSWPLFPVDMAKVVSGCMLVCQFIKTSLCELIFNRPRQEVGANKQTSAFSAFSIWKWSSIVFSLPPTSDIPIFCPAWLEISNFRKKMLKWSFLVWGSSSSSWHYTSFKVNLNTR